MLHDFFLLPFCFFVFVFILSLSKTSYTFDLFLYFRSCPGYYPQGNQRRAIMDSLMAAQSYCLQTTCRRKFLLEYFGEKFESDKCGRLLVKFIC